MMQCLDDNKNLILAILENQNLGKLAECAQWILFTVVQPSPLKGEPDAKTHFSVKDYLTPA
nr:GRF1-interacting factor 2-like [Ipomoea batatas]